MNDKIKIIDKGGVTSAKGYKAASVTAGLKRSGKADMALIVSDSEAEFAGAFTSCVFKAAPVLVCLKKAKAGGKIKAVIVNSGNANACTGAKGVETAEKMCAITADALRISADLVLPASTGRIGVQMPMDKIANGIAKASASLKADGGAEAALAIMTTDTVPKEAAASFEVNGRRVTVGGMVKGAGMIAPKVKPAELHATMLGFITTDAAIDRKLLYKFIGATVEESFNKVNVDGDMSTNDTVILMANGASGVEIKDNTPEAALFAEALDYVTSSLAKSMVMDGEGVTKFVTLEITNAANKNDAILCARAISNSLLCKTAWFGGDPNWGRVMAAAGYSGAQFNPDKVEMYYDHKAVVINGMDAGTPEKELAEVMKNRSFTIKVNLNCGNASYTMWTNDISYEYVKINAEYYT